MIKKVVIAASGQGTRMLPLTRNKPKHLIKIFKKPFLFYLLENIKKAGYKELILVAGFKIEKIREFLAKEKYKIKLVNQFEILGGKEKIYGTACPLKCVKDIIGQEDFLLVYGDNLYSPRDLKSFNLEDGYNYVAGIVSQKPEKYGVLKTKNGFLKKIIEKPQRFVGNLINTGLYKFTPVVFSKVEKIKLSKRGEYELTDILNLLAEEKKVKVKEIKDYWLDFGNLADIPKVSKFLRNKYQKKKKKNEKNKK